MEFGKRAAEDPYFKKIPPLTLFELRQSSRNEPFVIPEAAKNRVKTNCIGFFFFAAVILAWVIFTIYLSQENNLCRFTNGVDSCGNICGTLNKKIKKTDEVQCKPEDYTNHPMLMYMYDANGDLVPDTCVKYEIQQMLSKLQQVASGKETFHIITQSTTSMLVTVAFSIGLSIVLVVALSINTRYTFLTFIGIQVCIFTGSDGVFWYFYGTYKAQIYLYYGSVMTVATGIFLAVLPFLLAPKRFNLIVGLYQRAAKRIMKVPLMLTLPLISVMFLLLVNDVAFYTILLCFSSMDETSQDFSQLPTGYFIFMGIVLVWLYAFVNGCQCMIVSGAIAAYFFSKDGKTSKKAVLKSMWVMVRYHMGTIAMGALIITILSFVKILAHLVRRLIGKTPKDPAAAQNAAGGKPGDPNAASGAPAASTSTAPAIPGAPAISSPAATLVLTYYNRCFTRCLEEPAEYLTKNAYIMTAMHGTPLYISGRRAARLTWYFLLDRLVVDSLGYLVMHGFSFMIFCSALILAFGVMTFLIRNMEITIYYVLLLAYLAGTVSYFYFSLLNVTAETILLCVCEDKFLSDILSTEYFMSKSLETLMITLSVLTKEPARKPRQPRKSFFFGAKKHATEGE